MGLRNKNTPYKNIMPLKIMVSHYNIDSKTKFEFLKS